jgi:hypothetical protein
MIAQLPVVESADSSQWKLMGIISVGDIIGLHHST